MISISSTKAREGPMICLLPSTDFFCHLPEHKNQATQKFKGNRDELLKYIHFALLSHTNV